MLDYDLWLPEYQVEYQDEDDYDDAYHNATAKCKDFPHHVS